MWVLFNWLSGTVIREFETESKDKDTILLDIQGDDSATLSIALDSLPTAVRNNWRNEFVGIKTGVLYYENFSTSSTPEYEALYAGQVTRVSQSDNTLKLTATSMLDYLSHIPYAPPGVTTITDSKAVKAFKNVSGKEYVSEILKCINEDSACPDITIGAGTGGGSNFTTSIRLRELNSVGQLLKDQLEDPAGTEFRFIPKLNAAKTLVTWEVVFPSGNRTFYKTSTPVSIDLSNPNVELIELSPSVQYEDFYNTLWNEIEVEEGISIKRDSNITAGFPRYGEYVDFQSALTPAERAVQVAARLAANNQGLENWELQVFNEAVNYDGDVTKPRARFVGGLLGKPVAVIGGAAYDAASLNGTYRCMGIEFSSHTSNIRVQLSDVRDTYPRMPKRVIDRVSKDLKKSGDPTFKIPKYDIPTIPDPDPTDPEIPDPILDIPTPDWDWGTEVPPFPGQEPNKNNIYGFDGANLQRFSPWVRGDNMPTWFPSGVNTDTWLWTQGSKGNDIYCGFVEGSYSNTSDQSRSGDELRFALGQTGTGSNRIMFLQPNGAGLNWKFVISSGILQNGNIVDFERRFEMPIDVAFASEILFGTGDITSRSIQNFPSPTQAHRVVIRFDSMTTLDDRLHLHVDVEIQRVSGNATVGFIMKRIIVLRKTGHNNFDNNFSFFVSRGLVNRKDWIHDNALINKTMPATQIQDKVLMPFLQDAGAYVLEDSHLFAASLVSNTTFEDPYKIPQPETTDSEDFNYNGSRLTGDRTAASFWTRDYLVAKTPLGMELVKIVNSSSSPNTPFNFAAIPLRNTGLGSTYDIWTPKAKDLSGTTCRIARPGRIDTSSFLLREQHGLSITGTQLLTVEGVPLAFSFGLTNTSNNVPDYARSNISLVWGYVNRYYVARLTDEGEPTQVYGSPGIRYVEGYETPGGTVPLDTSDPRRTHYDDYTSIPQLSYNGMALPKTDKPADLFWSSTQASGWPGYVTTNTRIYPKIFYFNGYVYALPNYTPSGYGEDSSGARYIPPLVSFKLIPRYEPYEFPKGNEPVNAWNLSDLIGGDEEE